MANIMKKGLKMKKKEKQIIANWKKATQELAEVFVAKYYPENDDFYWVGDEIGSVFSIADMFFTVDRMKEALQLNATFEQLCEYDEKEIETLQEGGQPPINFRNFVKYGWNLEKTCYDKNAGG